MEGPGGREGVVLPMEMVGSGLYEAAYVVEIRVGREGEQQSFQLQVDSGSSDLWVSANTCSTSSCDRNQGRLYNPSASGATDTGLRFDIQYLRGRVEGPIYWDRVNIGGYSVENQALSAASTVDDEPLARNFNGILGLALPLNSVIAQRLPPGVTNDPDGQAWASNLFSITPNAEAPANRFISMTLSRPGSNRIPSLLGIGRHPEGLVPNPGLVEYSPLVPERFGTLFWKTSIRAMTVYNDGVPMEIQLPRGVSGGVFPSAIVDSGVPLIVTSPAVANAIYGAIGISPAQDGQYYVPCNKPLNMTMTLDNRRPIPLHPLDLTADPPQDNRAAFCIGLIQVDAQLGRPNTIGDMILGVPFMRNVYTVMAYTQPNPDGTFPPISEDATSVPGNPGDPPTWTTTPRLGMLGITDPQIALEEFHTVRVLNKPLGDLGANGRNSPGADGDHNGTKPSTGVIVIIALVGAFVVCSLFFGIRWFITRRRYRKQRAAGMSDSSEQFAFQPTGETKRELLMDSMLGMATGGYQLANSTRYSRAPTDSIHTLRDRDGRFPDDHLSKFDSRVSSNRGTTYSGRTLKDSISSAARPTSLALDHSPRQSLDVVDAPMPPTSSSSSSTPINQPRHRPEGSVTSPLISSSAYDTPDNGDSNTPYYPPSAYPHRRHHHRDSSSSPSSSPPPNPHSTQPMAGVGTASRTKKLSMDLDSFNRRASGSVDSDREPGFAGFGSPTSVYSTPDASNKISIPVPPRARTKSNHTSDESTGSNSNYHHSRAVQSQDEMEMSPMLRRS